MIFYHQISSLKSAAANLDAEVRFIKERSNCGEPCTYRRMAIKFENKDAAWVVMKVRWSMEASTNRAELKKKRLEGARKEEQYAQRRLRL